MVEDKLSTGGNGHETAHEKRSTISVKRRSEENRPRISSNRRPIKTVISGVALPQAENIQSIEKSLLEEKANIGDDEHEIAEDKRSNVSFERLAGTRRPRIRCPQERLTSFLVGLCCRP